MKVRHLYLLLLMTVWLHAAHAQNSILWEISGNGVTSPSYIMGTLKFIGEQEFFIPKEAEQKLKQCKIFVIEDPVDHHAQHELNSAVHFEKGKSLKTELSPGDYQKLLDLFQKEFGITPEQFESDYAKMIPLALSITMTRLSLGEQVMFYDIELLRLAKENKLSTFSLEPIQRESEAIHKFPVKDQVSSLLHSIENFDKQKEEYKKLMAIYPYGDLQQIFEYTLHPTDNNPLFIEEFYTKRNIEWIPKIEKMVHDKPAFIAIGVSHLEGDKGVLNLLREKGYTLTPVTVTR